MTLFAIFLFLLAICVHEAGHALVMRRYNVRIKEICLLGFGPTLLSFKIRRIWGETPITIRAVPLGAFVQPEDPGYMERLSYVHKSRINVAGIIANILFAAVLLSVSLLVAGVPLTTLWLLLAGLVVFALFLWFIPFVAVVAGIGFMGFLITELITDPVAFQKSNGSVVTVVEMAVEQNDAPEDVSFSDRLLKAFYFGFAMSLGLALFNILPLMPLDGGRVAVDTIVLPFSERMRVSIRKWYTGLTAGVIVCVIVSALYTDLTKVVAYFVGK